MVVPVSHSVDIFRYRYSSHRYCTYHAWNFFFFLNQQPARGIEIAHQVPGTGYLVIRYRSFKLMNFNRYIAWYRYRIHGKMTPTWTRPAWYGTVSIAYGIDITYMV